MRIFSEFSSLESIPCPVLTIGTFDGVHLGHQKIIDQLNKEAMAVGGESVLFTFYPHPRMVLFPDSHGLQLIQTQEEKLDKLKRIGLQNVIVYPFTYEFSRLTALEFVRDFLVTRLKVKKVVIGYDHQFGKNREGSIEFLKKVSHTYDFEVIEIPAQEIDAVNISSTKIRQAILEGELSKANHFLGDPFQLNGTVVVGNALGRTIGYPTANILVNSDMKLVPGNGVYRVTVDSDGERFNGMMNIGIRPTVGGTPNRTLEVHIFDFDADIYGKSITVCFLSKWREEMKFGSLDELKAQLKKDEEAIRYQHSTAN
ncbi:MAG: bifunctional riboflavin kinase/FAD synthetase [Flavobacteriia bacterium]